MDHRFAVGDRVSLAFGFHDVDAVGLYTITRLLPSLADTEPQYRVIGSDDRERVIGEAQIQATRPHAVRSARPRSSHNPITEMLNRLGVRDK